jgi:hypothetical protein
MKILDETYLRNIKLELLLNFELIKTLETDIDISKRFNTKLRLFYPNKKLINVITDFGGVLIGSRSMKCHLINGRHLLNRKCNDWDFIVTLDMAFDICSKMNINQIPKIDEIISVKNQRYWVHSSYSDSYRVGIVDVHMIIREELPLFIESNKIRVATFDYALSNKIGLLEEIQKTNYLEYKKHMDDLTQILINFTSIKNSQNI